jgi:TolB-like protein
MDPRSFSGAGRKAFILAALAATQASWAQAGSFKHVAKELSRGAGQDGVVRVAVLPFTPTDDSRAQDGSNIAERLITQLVRQGRVKTIERGLLRQVMEEHYLARTGIVDTATLRRLGGILSVDALVTGSFVTLGSEVKVNARLIDVETGVILAAVEETVAKDWFDSRPGLETTERPARPTIWAAPAAPALVAAKDPPDLRDSVAEPRCAGAQTNSGIHCWQRCRLRSPLQCGPWSQANHPRARPRAPLLRGGRAGRRSREVDPRRQGPVLGPPAQARRLLSQPRDHPGHDHHRSRPPVEPL